MSAETPFRTGYVAIIGEPNVGKSTLMNTLVGQKISIVTDKPQTTRHKIIGILSRPSFQIVFLDTPGLLKPRYRLHEAMMKSARAAIEDADLILFMIDGSHPGNKSAEALNSLDPPAKRVYLVINKADLVPKTRMLPVIASFSALFPFKEVFPVSALKADGTAELIDSIAAELPEHPPFFPPDVVSEQPERFFVAEIIREKIFAYFREEVPYSTTVDIISFTEAEGKKDVINAEIYVERDSQKAILIGKEGRALREIGKSSRADIEKFLGRGVFLELHVKVRERWREKDAWLRRLGYPLS